MIEKIHTMSPLLYQIDAITPLKDCNEDDNVVRIHE